MTLLEARKDIAKYRRNHFETKKKIVLEGRSEVFKNWKEYIPDLTEEAFIEGLEWVCDDQLDEKGRLTREFAANADGSIVKLRRVHDNLGMCSFRTEDGRLWSGTSIRVDCDPLWAEKDGKRSIQFNVGINAEDRI